MVPPSCVFWHISDTIIKPLKTIKNIWARLDFIFVLNYKIIILPEGTNQLALYVPEEFCSPIILSSGW